MLSWSVEFGLIVFITAASVLTVLLAWLNGTRRERESKESPEELSPLLGVVYPEEGKEENK